MILDMFAFGFHLIINQERILNSRDTTIRHNRWLKSICQFTIEVKLGQFDNGA